MSDDLKKKLPNPEQANNLVKIGEMSPESRDHIVRLHSGDMTDNEKDVVDQALTQNATTAPERAPAAVPEKTTGASGSWDEPQTKPSAPMTGELQTPAQTEPQTPTQMIDSGFGLQQAGVAMGAKAQAAGASQAAGQYGDLAAKQQEHLANMQKMQAQMEAERVKHMADQKAADDNIVKAQPKDFWADKTSGTKMLAGISIALGSLGASLTGGKNTALDVINSTIERDAQLQKDKYNMAVNRGQRLDSRFAEAMKTYGDQATAMNAVMAQNIAMTQTKVQQIAQQTSSQEVKAASIKLIGELDTKKGEFYQNNAAQLMKHKAEMIPRLIPSEGQYAPTPEAAKAINEAAADMQTTNRHLEALEKIAKEPFKSLSPDLKEKAKIHANMLIGLIGKGILDGANPKVTERMQKILEETVADPTSMTTRDSTILSSLHLVRESTKMKYNNTLRANGIRPSMPTVEDRK